LNDQFLVNAQNNHLYAWGFIALLTWIGSHTLNLNIYNLVFVKNSLSNFTKLLLMYLLTQLQTKFLIYK